MFKDYFKELENSDCFGDQDGFILYADKGEYFYISHCYVAPHARGKRKSLEYVNMVADEARKRGVKTIVSCTSVSVATAVLSLTAQLAYGFKPYQAEMGEIWLKYEVE